MPLWRRFGWAWNDLGANNPLGAILTKDGKVAAWNLDEFLATGKADAARFVSDLTGVVPGVSRARALDFGCGVGRITRALAEHFDQVVGVDVAPSMIARAQELNADTANCQFVVNRKPNLRAFPDESFSVVYCRLVLQHIRPEVVRRYIPEMVRVLRKDGVLMFQLPERVPGVDHERATFEAAPVDKGSLKRFLPRGVVTLWRRLKFKRIISHRKAFIEMFGVNRADVLPIVRDAGGRVLEVRHDDTRHGYEQVDSFEYWITK